MGPRQQFHSMAYAGILDFIKTLQSFDDTFAEAVEAYPASITDGKKFSEIATDEAMCVFADIMCNVPEENEIPIEHFKLLMSAKSGGDVSVAEAKETLTKMRDERKAASYLERTSYAELLQAEGRADERPELLKLLDKREEAKPHIPTLAQHWGNLLSIVGSLTLSDSAHVSTVKSTDLRGAFIESVKRSLTPKDNGTKIPVNVKTKDQDSQKGDKKAENDNKDFSKCKAKVHLAEDLGPIEQEMERLIGLDEAKEQIKSIESRVRHDKLLREVGLAPEKERGLLEHYVFKGNPGTGKTTFARLVGKLYKDAGLLESGHVIETERSDLVGEYIGHTGPKTRELIEHAKGGVLFVDEAYTLDGGGGKDFGKEALATILKGMEVNKGDLVVILAGYPAEMERLIDTNPGLSSRFKYNMNFTDFTDDQLMDIFDLNMANLKLTITPEARDKVQEMLVTTKNKDPKNFGNARTVENTVDVLKDKLAARLEAEGTLTALFALHSQGDLSDEDKSTLTRIEVADFEALEKMQESKTPAQVKRPIGFCPSTAPVPNAA